jgi:hypothetical protein
MGPKNTFWGISPVSSVTISIKKIWVPPQGDHVIGFYYVRTFHRLHLLRLWTPTIFIVIKLQGPDGCIQQTCGGLRTEPTTLYGVPIRWHETRQFHSQCGFVSQNNQKTSHRRRRNGPRSWTNQDPSRFIGRALHFPDLANHCDSYHWRGQSILQVTNSITLLITCKVVH